MASDRIRIQSVVHEPTGLPIGPEVDMAPARRPDPTAALEGRHVRLVPIDPAAHSDTIYDAAHGSEREAQFLYLFPPPFPDRAAFRAYIEGVAAGQDPFMYAILDRASGEAVGHATYMRIEPAHRCIEVGNILYTPKLQRSPGATEAMYLMARHAFEDLGYRRYEWKCNALNAPSRRAALRYGFSFEGIFRRHMIVKGRNRDTAWFAVVAEDWPSRKAAFERWLDPANFDPEGRQRVSLSVLNAQTLEADGLVLRRADADDAEGFETLQQAAYAWNRQMLGREPLPLQISAAEVLSRYETWLAEEEGRVAGALALEPHGDHLLIWSISVDPARQNGGIGRRMLAAAEVRARQLGLSTIRLYTGAPLTKNIDWYGRRGYAVERNEDMADGRTAVHLVKHI